MWTSFLIIQFVISSTYQHYPKCYRSNNLLSFDEMMNPSNYKKARKEACSTEISKICTKNITISYFPMEPFTNAEILNESVTINEKGILQKILRVALAQCCGNCIKLKYENVHDRKILTNITTKTHSDILLPMFSQGLAYHTNSSIPQFTIPLVHLSGAMFITKKGLSPKLFARDVVVAIFDIWPLFGVSLLLTFIAGVVIWIIDTWTNRAEFPRRFVTGAFEGL